MNTHRLTVTNHSGSTRVLLDGEDIADALTEMTVRFRPGQLPQVEMELHAPADVGVELEVVIPEKTAALLRHLGWTPPGGAAS